MPDCGVLAIHFARCSVVGEHLPVGDASHIYVSQLRQSQTYCALTARAQRTDVKLRPKPEHRLDVFNRGRGVVRQHFIAVGIIRLEERTEEILADVVLVGPQLRGIASHVTTPASADGGGAALCAGHALNCLS